MNPRSKLTTRQAAIYLGVSTRTMERMREENSGPSWFKAGNAFNSPCLYELADLDMWVLSRKRRQGYGA